MAVGEARAVVAAALDEAGRRHRRKVVREQRLDAESAIDLMAEE
jgi:hypothetical protein